MDPDSCVDDFTLDKAECIKGISVLLCLRITADSRVTLSLAETHFSSIGNDRH